MKDTNTMRRAVWLGSLIFATVSLVQARAAQPGAEVGQELRKIERDVRQASPAPEKSKPEVTVQKPVQPAATNAAARGPAKMIEHLEIRGDDFVFDRARLRAELQSEVVGLDLSVQALREIASRYQKKLVDAGWYLATVTVIASEQAKGVAAFSVDAGRVGRVTLFERGTQKSVPYAGHYFSESQIRGRLGSVHEGMPFYYPDLYRSVYGINAHPDLTMDVNLKLRSQETNGVKQRIADVDAEVDDDLPFHVGIELGNDGTDITEEWRGGLTFQHVNLTKRDDVLTLTTPFSLDFSTIKSVAGSYYLPHHWRKGGSISVFGGYSELKAEDVVTALDLNGSGWFVGAQGSYNFIYDERGQLAVALGLQRSVIEDELVVSDVATPRSVTTAPVILTLMYNSTRPDRWGGLNSVASSLAMNRGGLLGSSEDEEFELQRENAVADYFVERLQLARVQALQSTDRDPNRQWNLFSRLEAQYATDPLIPAEQKGAGGFSTVRGYMEREVLGDDGLNGSFELRTPIRKSSVLPRWFSKNPERYQDFEAMQYLVFVDGAYLTLKDAVAGQEDSQTLLSAGLGMRLSLGSRFAARADWGFPLEKTEESDSTGRGHFSVQYMF